MRAQLSFHVQTFVAVTSTEFRRIWIIMENPLVKWVRVGKHWAPACQLTGNWIRPVCAMSTVDRGSARDPRKLSWQTWTGFRKLESQPLYYVLIEKSFFLGIGIHVIKIEWSWYRLLFVMGIQILLDGIFISRHTLQFIFIIIIGLIESNEQVKCLSI